MARLMSETLTLYAALAALRAQALLAAEPGAVRPESGPTSAEIAAALAAIGAPAVTSAKLELLRVTMAGYDAQGAALRLTPSCVQRLLAPTMRKTRAKTNVSEASENLTAAALDTMTPNAWAEAMRWLAEQAGCSVEETSLLERDTLLAWNGRRGSASERVVICAQRLTGGASLLADDMWRLAALGGEAADTSLVALTTAEATVGARLIARDIHAVLLDRAELDQLLAKLATAYSRDREQSKKDTRAQAKAAAAARKKLVATLTAAESLSKTPPAAQRATGRAGVRKAVEQARDAHRLAAQALVAWETLAREWLATFGERPARDGSLPLLAEPQVWAELGERADHLKKPLMEALRALSKTPGDGDLEYGAWRQALGDELAARCGALLWRANTVDPSQADDFSAAFNELAVREASRADNAASHAAARAARAQSQLNERAGVA
jgi:hypothetical protein